MDSGITFAQQYQLRPGVALSALQMAQLTRDIVWLVEQSVTLPDGTVTRALVPQVYIAHLMPDDLQESGVLLAGSSVSITAAGDVNNTGTIAGRKVVRLPLRLWPTPAVTTRRLLEHDLTMACHYCGAPEWCW